MKIAIIIWGVQNSGKTASFRGIVHNYSEKRIQQMRRGWQRLFLNSNFRYLNLDSYFFPASPTETRLNLVDHFSSWNHNPDVLFIAEQINGQSAINTTTFLNNNSYQILNYTLSNITGSGTWDRFDNTTEQIKLKSRADEIIDDIRAFIRTNQIV
jgi:hypothetical protein